MTGKPLQRFLEFVRPPDKAGRIRSFCGMTYEFNATFFEIDFLPTIFNMGAWQIKGWSSRIALERHLQDAYVGVVIDGQNYRERPTLRVDMIPFTRPSGSGKQHAKLYLLTYEHRVRLIVTSANLTDHGSRRNYECATAIDCTPKNTDGGKLIVETIDTWKRIIGSAMTEEMAKSMQATSDVLQEWMKKTQPNRPAFKIAWCGVDHSLPRQLSDAWPGSDRIQSIDIVSPFWSQTDASALDGLIESFKDLVEPSSGLRIRLYCAVRRDNDQLPSLPPVIGEWAVGRNKLKITAHAVNPHLSEIEKIHLRITDSTLAVRSLHSKMIIVRGNKTAMVYLGSANCTRRGWGWDIPAHQANLEAGVIVVSDKSPTSFDILIPETAGKEVELGKIPAGELQYSMDDVESKPWPGFIERIELIPDPKAADRLNLCVLWRAVSAPASWAISLRLDGGMSEALCEFKKARGRSACRAIVLLSPDSLQRILTDREVLVCWLPFPAGTPFPVNVTEHAKDRLPVAPNVLFPGEDALLAYYQGRLRWEDLFPEPHEADKTAGVMEAPLRSEVDTGKIQTYQIREFVEALPGIIQEIVSVLPDERTLRRSLLGPISPVELGRQIETKVRECKRGRTAGAFQLLELQYAVARAYSLRKRECRTKEEKKLFIRAIEELNRLSRNVFDGSGAETMVTYAKKITRQTRKCLAS